MHPHRAAAEGLDKPASSCGSPRRRSLVPWNARRTASTLPARPSRLMSIATMDVHQITDTMTHAAAKTSTTCRDPLRSAGVAAAAIPEPTRPPTSAPIASPVEVLSARPIPVSQRHRIESRSTTRCEGDFPATTARAKPIATNKGAPTPSAIHVRSGDSHQKMPPRLIITTPTHGMSKRASTRSQVESRASRPFGS